MMRALSLDYRTNGRRARLAGYALAVFALGFGADTALYYRSLLRDVGARERALAGAKLASDADAWRRTRVQPVSAEEYAFARETVRRLSMPWHTLFAALEASQGHGITLVAIEPDPENRTVTISGEAADYLAVLAYLANLADQPALRDVRLKHHEMKSAPAGNSVAFAISSRWQP